MNATEYRLLRRFEAGRNVAPELGDRASTPTGEPYVTLSGPGGEPEAVAAFEAYAAGRRGRMQWRCTPEVGPRGFFMRLFIEP